MAQTAQQTLLPLVDDITVKDVLADTVVGVSIVSGNAHITFATVTADHTVESSPSRRIISSRLALPLPAMIELRDILSRVVDTLTAQGIITPTLAGPTIVSPSSQAD
jgi:hypothetical protein